MTFLTPAVVAALESERVTRLTKRLLDAAIAYDKEGCYQMAKLLTEAIEEIENARKGHIRDSVDKGAEQGWSKELPGLREDRRE